MRARVSFLIKSVLPVLFALTLVTSCEKENTSEPEQKETPIVVNLDALTVRESGTFSPADLCYDALQEIQEGNSPEDSVRAQIYRTLLDNLYSANLYATQEFIDINGGNLSLWTLIKTGTEAAWNKFSEWVEETVDEGVEAVKEAWNHVLTAYEWLRMGYAIVDYPSTSADGTPITLSMLVCWPERVGLPDPSPNTLVIGNHVTRTRYDEVPSYFKTLSSATDVHLLATTWATASFILPDVIDGIREIIGDPREALLVMPDYEGYGASLSRTHPYLNRNVQARQSLEAALYAKEWFEKNKKKEFTDDYKTIAIGYSQGGAVSAATYRYALENGYADDLNFVGAVCGDGPYEPEQTLKTYISSNILSMPVSIALVLKGLCETDPEMIKVGAKPQDFSTESFYKCGIYEKIGAKIYTTDECGDCTWHYADEHPGAFQWKTYVEPDGKEQHTHLCTNTAANKATIDYFTDGTLPDDKTLALKLQTLGHCLQKHGLTYSEGGTWVPPSDAKFTFFHARRDDVVPYENMDLVRLRWGYDKAKYIEYNTDTWIHSSVGSPFFIYYSFREALKILEGDWKSGASVVSGGSF